MEIHRAFMLMDGWLVSFSENLASRLLSLSILFQIVFSSLQVGSESNNTVIKGYCLKHQADGKHIITTALEHHAVLEPIEYLVERFGFEVTIVQPRDGRIQASDIKAALRPDTILVSTMFANNETGDLSAD